jgi:hypothetical protein
LLNDVWGEIRHAGSQAHRGELESGDLLREESQRHGSSRRSASAGRLYRALRNVQVFGIRRFEIRCTPVGLWSDRLTESSTKQYSCVDDSRFRFFRQASARNSHRDLEANRKAAWLLGSAKAVAKSLQDAFRALKAAGCTLVYLDGSFVTSKPEPGDFDACWGIDGVDADNLDPVFLDFSRSRSRQKRRFLGEFFPAELPEGATGKTFLQFFQTDKETGDAKGIPAIDLRRWHP